MKTAKKNSKPTTGAQRSRKLWAPVDSIGGKPVVDLENLATNFRDAARNGGLRPVRVTVS